MSNKIKKKNANSSSSAKKDTVSAPLAVSVTSRASKPNMNGSDSLKIHRREFVGTATNGAVTSFMLTPASLALPGYDFNPAVSLMFPWLSHIAVCYERFRFNSLKVEFMPSQSASTAGRYYAAIDYDYDDNPASTKAELMGNLSCVEAPVWQPMTLVANKASLTRDLPYRYVSNTQRTAFVENRTAYSGFLMIGFDTPTANCIVDVWVEYDVEFVTPVNDGVFSQIQEVNALNAPVTTAVTEAKGTGFCGLPKPVNGIPNGPVKIVIPGTMGVPTMTFGHGGVNVDATTAIDIRHTKGMGMLDVMAECSVTGVSPSVLSNAANSFDITLYLFDMDGVWQADLIYSPTVIPLALYATAYGAYPGKSATNGDPVRRSVSFLIEDIIRALPTAAFIVLVASNLVAAYGGGKSGYSFKYRL